MLKYLTTVPLPLLHYPTPPTHPVFVVIGGRVLWLLRDEEIVANSLSVRAAVRDIMRGRPLLTS